MYNVICRECVSGSVCVCVCVCVCVSCVSLQMIMECQLLNRCLTKLAKQYTTVS